MSAKLPISLGDNVRHKFFKKTFEVVKCFKKTCWIQQKNKSKYLKNSHPTLKNIPYEDLLNWNWMVNFLKDYNLKRQYEKIQKSKEDYHKYKDKHLESTKKYYRRRRKEDPSYQKEQKKYASNRRYKEQKTGNWRILLKTNSFIAAESTK